MAWLGLTLLLGACSPTLWMRPAPMPERFVAPPDRALLVVLRPSGAGSSCPFMLINGNDPPQFLGQPVAKGVFTVAVPEGRVHLIAKSEHNADVIEATVAKGRVYFVLAAVRPGPGELFPVNPRVVLTALTPNSKQWPKLEPWLSKLTYYTVDTANSEAAEETNRYALDWVDEALAAWSSYDESQRAQRILSPEDGQQ